MLPADTNSPKKNHVTLGADSGLHIKQGAVYSRNVAYRQIDRWKKKKKSIVKT